MTTARQLFDEALSWEGTPVRWAQAAKGQGCDCKGLLAGLACGLSLPEGASLYAQMRDYGQHGKVDIRLLRRGLSEVFLKGALPLQLADVVLLRMAGKPQHLGIYGDGLIVHAYGAGDPKTLQQVKISRADTVLRAWPLDSLWRWRSLEG